MSFDNLPDLPTSKDELEDEYPILKFDDNGIPFRAYLDIDFMTEKPLEFVVDTSLNITEDCGIDFEEFTTPLRLPINPYISKSELQMIKQQLATYILGMSMCIDRSPETKNEERLRGADGFSDFWHLRNTLKRIVGDEEKRKALYESLLKQ